MEFNNLIDKKNIFNLIGCYCNNPKAIFNNDTKTNIYDYPETFYQIIYTSIYNLAKKGADKIGSFEIQNEINPFNEAIKIFNDNNGVDYIERAKEFAEDKPLNAPMYRDNVRKYSLIRNAIAELGMDITGIYNEQDENMMAEFNKMSSSDVLKLINNKVINFKEKWKDDFSDEERYRIGDEIDNIMEKLEAQENTYGYPYQDPYMNTILKGMKPGKLVLVSASSGQGKTRIMMGDSTNIACSRMYVWKTKSWISLGETEGVLFISTELTKEEMTTMALAHISGIEQDKIEEWNLSEEEIVILRESATVIKESKLYCVNMPEYTCDKIAEEVDRHIINHDIVLLAMDYINDSSSLSAESYSKNKMHLRSDQILYGMTLALKNIAIKFGIHVKSATQLNTLSKEDKTANALKGSRSIQDKIDAGFIRMPVTPEDRKKLKPILDKLINVEINCATYCYKNRGGRWKDCVIFGMVNLGTCREVGCFVTDYQYNLISDISPTEIGIDFEGIVDKCTNFELDGTEDTISDTIKDFKLAK